MCQQSFRTTLTHSTVHCTALCSWHTVQLITSRSSHEIIWHTNNLFDSINVTLSRAHAIGRVSLHGNVITHCSRFFRPNSVIGVLPMYRVGRTALAVGGGHLCANNNIVTFCQINILHILVHFISNFCHNNTMLTHFPSSESSFHLFPVECFNFQEPHKIPITSKAATPPATTPPRKEPATAAPTDSAAPVDCPEGAGISFTVANR